MSISSSRPFASNPNYPTSPAPTTASSLNYSQYGSTSFSPAPTRNATAPPSSAASSSAIGVGGGMRHRPGGGSIGGGAGGSGLRPPDSAAGGGKRMDSKEVAKVHWRALREFLQVWLEKEPPAARASAREKLTRLTKLQFQELSTDVYDEFMRRMAQENGGPDDSAPFLPVRDDFHPKRNQARQKLATLPKNRFKDLASDVLFELERRHPEFQEDDEEKLQYEEPPAPGPIPVRPGYSQNNSQASIRDRMRENPTPPPMNRLNSGSSHQRQASRGASGGSSVGSLNRPQERGMSYDRQNGYSDRPTNLTATNEVVVPNKSRLREEEIEVPYARDSRIVQNRPPSMRSDSWVSVNERPGSRTSHDGGRVGARTPRGQPSEERTEVISPGMTDDREYYDRMSFSSNVTNKSKPLVGGWDDDREQKLRAEYEFRIAGLERKLAAPKPENDFETEKRRELEDEIRGLKEGAATHASALRSMQHELDIARDAAATARKHTEESSRSAQDEVAQWRDRCDGLEDEIRRLEEELASLKLSRGPGSETLPELKAEIHSLVDELNALSIRNDELMTEREHDAQMMNEMEAKVDDYKRKHDAVRIELRNLKATSTMFVSKPMSDDHFPASADGNIDDIHVSSFQTAVDGILSAARSSTPSGVLPAMKAVVESITEIGEDVKAFEQHPNLDVDSSRLESLKHESTTCLNNLMQAARNHAMASGLSPVSLIDAAAGHLSANVVEIIKLLKIRRSAKRELRRERSSLSIKDMVNRSGDLRNGGLGSGEYGSEERLREPAIMVRQPSNTAPVGGKMGRMTPTELSPSRLNGPQTAPPGSSAPAPFRINSFQSASSQAKSDSFDLERKASVTSDRAASVRPMVESRNGMNGYRGGSTSPPGSGTSPAPPPGYDRGSGLAYDQGDQKASVDEEREWEDLKPYLNTQSSLLVNAIQNLLASIRTGGSPQLNEHLSEVIAIASSIVAVSTNSLPTALRPAGDGLLRDLVANTNTLSEAQESAKVGFGGQGGQGGQGGFEKGVRQQIASASFGVAKSLKALMRLGTGEDI